MQRLRLLLPAVLLIFVFVFGLAACGGGESDEDKITSTIETAATSTDPAVCGETQTLQFMETTAGGSGKEAEKECEKEAKAGENNPESVAVEEEPSIKPQVAGCIVEGLEELPKAELETLVVENNTQPIVELAESCE